MKKTGDFMAEDISNLELETSIKKPLEQKDARVLITETDSNGNVTKITDITEKFFVLNGNGAIAKDDFGNYKKEGVTIEISQQPIDAENGNSVNVYVATIIEADGQRTAYKTDLIHSNQLQFVEGVKLDNTGKPATLTNDDLNKYSTNFYTRDVFDITSVSKDIEDFRREYPESKNTNITFELKAKNEVEIKDKNDSIKLLGYGGGSALLAFGVVNPAIPLAIIVATYAASKLSPDQKISNYPDISEVENIDGPSLYQSYSAPSFSKLDKILIGKAEEIIEKFKENAGNLEIQLKEGLEAALKEGTELNQKLSRKREDINGKWIWSKRQPAEGLNFTKNESKALVDLVVKLSKDGELTAKDVADIDLATTQLGITDSGKLNPNPKGVKPTRGGWNIKD
jgi:hypothetical protein